MSTIPPISPSGPDIGWVTRGVPKRFKTWFRKFSNFVREGLGKVLKFGVRKLSGSCLGLYAGVSSGERWLNEDDDGSCHHVMTIVPNVCLVCGLLTCISDYHSRGLPVTR